MDTLGHAFVERHSDCSEIVTDFTYPHFRVYVLLFLLISQRLKELVSQVSTEHLERAAEGSWRVHEQVLEGYRQDYAKAFIDSHQEKRRAEAAQAASEPAATGQ